MLGHVDTQHDSNVRLTNESFFWVDSLKRFGQTEGLADF